MRTGRIAALGPGGEAPRVTLYMARGGEEEGQPTGSARDRAAPVRAPAGPGGGVGCKTGAPHGRCHNHRGDPAVLEEWLERRHGSLTFRTTQVLTGHGCFGRYLCRIGREPDARCHHCVGCHEETARHVLEECAAWEGPRRTLVAELGGDLSLPTVFRKMVGSGGSWDAVVSFCEHVMAQKEACGEGERAYDRSPDPQ